MMKKRFFSALLVFAVCFGLSGSAAHSAETMKITQNTTVNEVINDKAFGSFGRLLFPLDRPVAGDMTFAEVSTSRVYVWYSHIQPSKTVEVIANLKRRSEQGEQVFYPIYTTGEIAADPSKADTGLFFFRGEARKPFAIMNAGGGFMYVGALHDSFPHALEVSKRGYNAFVLIYRPGSAYHDLARAIAYVHDHAGELRVSPENYSLWGGSAGARMAAALGNSSVLASYGLSRIPQAAAVIMQYTGYSAVSGSDAPSYGCVGTDDGVASWRTMQDRSAALKALGIDSEFHSYRGLSHGFGLGEGTAAEGWINDALALWQRKIDRRNSK